MALNVAGFRKGRSRSRRDVVTVEEPLEMRVEMFEDGRRMEKSVSVTMRTPGDDFELTAGFLFNEGLLAGRDDIVELRYCRGEESQDYNIVSVSLSASTRFDPGLLNRNFFMTSSCGVCGKASLEAIEIRGCSPLAAGGLEVRPGVLTAATEALRASQHVFERTGGIHAAALFDKDGALVVLREDVGRHNAVDKVIGHQLLEGRLPLGDQFMVVSGRASFEITQKALAGGIPILVAVGAPSSLAVETARRFHITLVGFAKPGGFNVYAGAERIREDPAASG
ncbi:MAG: formate dehydrogenase accessory sulfurtransferase FdhD [Gemmatimonadota bacterium]